jgi:hypothetical protein
MPAMALAAPALAVGTHAKPRTPVIRLRAPVVAPVVAAAALASVAAAFVSLHGGFAAAPSSHDAMAVTGAGAVSTGVPATDARSDVAAAKAGTAATLAAQRVHHARQQAARQQAAKRQAQQAAAAPPPSAAPPPPSTGGGDPADSALGVCIRNAEEGGSYAWGPGNGGGAYQFVLGTWETYGGAASEFGVAGPAYQDQIFNNAVNAGGASNWTAYDGC